MNFLVLLLLSATPAALLLLALVIRERRRRLPPLPRPVPIDVHSIARTLERADFKLRQRELALWNAQFRPSNDGPVFPCESRKPREPRKERPAFREYVHVDPFTEETVVKCGLMKKVVLPS